MHAGRKIVFTKSFYKTELILQKCNTKRTQINLHLYSETVKKIIILNYSNKKNNVKGTWKILNTIIRKGKRCSNYPDSYIHNGATVKNKKDIANGFNDCFVNEGPNLAKCIKHPKELKYS